MIPCPGISDFFLGEGCFFGETKARPSTKKSSRYFPAKFRWDTSHHATQEIHLQNSGFLIAKITGR